MYVPNAMIPRKTSRLIQSITNMYQTKNMTVPGAIRSPARKEI